MRKSYKIKDLRIKKNIADKHKKTLNFLWLITYIVFLPFALLQIITEKLDELIQIIIILREKIVYFIFKVIYKKEIVEDMKSRKLKSS